ncbi:hypothetical protein C8J57DRAFT_1258002 [Mycena rebaudengoi]|nr:hypothetical protein C8J57DRAFT_1258002 [Mycena rebaudengoi]
MSSQPLLDSADGNGNAGNVAVHTFSLRGLQELLESLGPRYLPRAQMGTHLQEPQLGNDAYCVVGDSMVPYLGSFVARIMSPLTSHHGYSSFVVTAPMGNPYLEQSFGSLLHLLGSIQATDAHYDSRTQSQQGTTQYWCDGIPFTQQAATVTVDVVNPIGSKALLTRNGVTCGWPRDARHDSVKVGQLVLIDAHLRKMVSTRLGYNLEYSVMATRVQVITLVDDVVEDALGGVPSLADVSSFLSFPMPTPTPERDPIEDTTNITTPESSPPRCGIFTSDSSTVADASDYATEEGVQDEYWRKGATTDPRHRSRLTPLTTDPRREPVLWIDLGLLGMGAYGQTLCLLDAAAYLQPHHLPLRRSTWRCPWRWTDDVHMPCSYNIDLEGRLAVQAHAKGNVTADGIIVLTPELLEDFKASLNDAIGRHSAEHAWEDRSSSPHSVFGETTSGNGAVDDTDDNMNETWASLTAFKNCPAAKTAWYKTTARWLPSLRGCIHTGGSGWGSPWDLHIYKHRPSALSLPQHCERRKLDTNAFAVLFSVGLYSEEMFAIVSDIVHMRTIMEYREFVKRARPTTGGTLGEVPLEVQHEILSNLDLPTGIVADGLEAHMRSIMAHFGLNWSDVRWMMTNTTSCFSGAVALLAIFLAFNGPLRDTCAVFDVVGDYCADSSGPRDDPDFVNNIYILFIFRMRMRGNGKLKINIIVTTTEDCTLPIHKFDSTALMNRIDANGSLCYYSDTTFELFGVLNSGSIQLDHEADILRLFRRTSQHTAQQLTVDDHATRVPHICTVHPLCLLTTRTTINEHCFYMGFVRPRPGSPVMERPRADKHIIAWALGGLPCIGSGFRPSVGWVTAVFGRLSPTSEEKLSKDYVREAWLERIQLVRNAGNRAQLVEMGQEHLRREAAIRNTRRAEYDGAVQKADALRAARLAGLPTNVHMESSSSDQDSKAPETVSEVWPANAST